MTVRINGKKIEKSSNYWEKEHPVVLFSEKNRMEWYPKAGMLSISKPEWEGPDGHPRQGKTVVLNLPAMADSEHREAALEMFRTIVRKLEENKMS